MTAVERIRKDEFIQTHRVKAIGVFQEYYES